MFCLASLFWVCPVRADMDWTELAPDAATASQKEFRAKTLHLDSLIQAGQYVEAVEYVYGEAAPMPKEYRKKAVDNAIEAIHTRYGGGDRAEATLEIMDLAIRFSEINILKRARNHMFASLVEDWQEDIRQGHNEVRLSQEANRNMCVLARGLISWGRRNFSKYPERGLAGMELARLYCPEGADIAYNLGIAQYRIGRIHEARRTWTELAGTRSWDSGLLCNLGWLCLELGDVDQADHYAIQALAAAPDSPNALAIRLEVLFARGQYREAVQTVFNNERQTTPRYEQRAVEYATAFGWKKFQSGNREEALAFVEGLSDNFPQAEPLAQAGQTMRDAISGGPADIPEFAGLPHLRKPGAPIYPPDHGDACDPLAIDPGPAYHRPQNAAFALVVGLKEYKHMLGPHHAERDARLFHDLLTNYMGFPEDRANIRLHTGHKAKSRNLRESISWLARNASVNPDALVLLYFSGKGAPVYAQDRCTVLDCLIMPYDADPDHPENGLPISLTEIKEAFAACHNPHVQIILDAGFFGEGKSVGLGKGIVPAAGPGLFQSQASIVFAAGVTREALEFLPGEQGAFSYFYFDAILGKGDLNQDGWVDSQEAFSWTCAAMKKQGVMQVPHAYLKQPERLSKVQ